MSELTDTELLKYDVVFKDFKLTTQEKKMIVKYVELFYKEDIKEYEAKEQAMMFAGYTVSGDNKTKRSKIARKFNKIEVKKAIVAYHDYILNDYAEETQNAIMKRLRYVLCDFNPKLLINSDGSLKYNDIDDLPPELAWMISSIETKWYGKEADRSQTVVKFHDVMKVMDLASKIYSMQKEILELQAQAKITDGQGNEIGSIPLINISVTQPPKEN
jgi:hypothetical protein